MNQASNQVAGQASDNTTQGGDSRLAAIAPNSNHLMQLLTKPASMSAYRKLKLASANKGKLASLNGIETLNAPTHFPGKDFETNYNKPPGFVVVSKSFLPDGNKEIRDMAVRHIEHCNQDDVSDMISLMYDIKDNFCIQANVLISNALRVQINKAGLPYSKERRQCNSTREVFNAYQTQELTMEFMEKIYVCYFQCWDNKNLMFEIMYKVMMTMGLWHCNDSKSKLNQTAKGLPKLSCFYSLVVTQVRQMRNKFSRVARINHGVKLTISVPNSRAKSNMARRNKCDGFDPSNYVQNWGGEKHHAFNKRLGVGPPPKLEEAVTAWRSKKAEAHGSSSFVPFIDKVWRIVVSTHEKQ